MFLLKFAVLSSFFVLLAAAVVPRVHYTRPAEIIGVAAAAAVLGGRCTPIYVLVDLNTRAGSHVSASQQKSVVPGGCYCSPGKAV